MNGMIQARKLIATTYNTDILDAPIRTDQVWFVDKSYYGISTPR